MKKLKVKKLTVKAELTQAKEKEYTLLTVLQKYVNELKRLRAETSLSLPAYGRDGEENIPGKSQPNVVFVKDLISQVEAARVLGFNTHLQSDQGRLSVVFVEKRPRLPVQLEVQLEALYYAK